MSNYVLVEPMFDRQRSRVGEGFRAADQNLPQGIQKAGETNSGLSMSVDEVPLFVA